MGFAEGRTWTAWLGRLTPGPAVGMRGEHNRVGTLWWERNKGEKDQIEKLRLEWAEDALGREQK